MTTNKSSKTLKQPKIVLKDSEIKLLKEIEILMNNGQYALAHDIVFSAFALVKSIPSFWGGSLACKLIDIGSEASIKEDIEEGLSYLKNNFDSLKKIIHPWSLEYNLANAKKSLFNTQRRLNEVNFSTSSLGLLVEAKNSYWKSYKLALEANLVGSHPEILVNLANSLSASGRVTEALYYLDLAIKNHPDFYMAHLNRSHTLEWLNNLSSAWTVKHIFEVKKGYQKATQLTKQRWIAEATQKKIERAEKILSEQKTKHHPEDDTETRKEFLSLPNLRKNHLSARLTLNEHSLYCNCLATARDNLTIPLTGISIVSDNSFAKMEHFLNRFKAEFGTARNFYDESQAPQSKKTKFFDHEIRLTDLNTNEVNSHQIELLRSSFRICIGILDKIAEAICELFDLSSCEEKIYFQSFWWKGDERLQKIDQAHNYSLFALYSQATDLNNKNGEWAFFKEWRNALEHGLFVVVSEKGKIEDAFGIFRDRRRIVISTESELKAATEHLLQFTRSAIFNFTFCAREEFLKRTKKSKNQNLPQIKLQPLIKERLFGDRNE